MKTVVALLLTLCGLGVVSSAPDSAVAEKPGRTTDVTQSPFGIGSSHSSNWGAPANAGWIPQMVAIGVTNHRCSNTGWSEVEPAEGKWNWDTLDKQMTYLEGQPIAPRVTPEHSGR